jgi:hypothetical protein
LDFLDEAAIRLKNANRRRRDLHLFLRKWGEEETENDAEDAGKERGRLRANALA